MPPGTPAKSIRSAIPAAQNDLSLASSGHTLASTPTAGSTLPTCSFAHSAAPLPEPLTAHSPSGGSLTASRTDLHTRPVLKPALDDTNCLTTLSLPVRIFALSDRSARSGRPPVGLSRNSPRSPFAPRCLRKVIKLRKAADHRSRSALLSVIRCSVNLLEPSTICAYSR